MIRESVIYVDMDKITGVSQEMEFNHYKGDDKIDDGITFEIKEEEEKEQTKTLEQSMVYIRPTHCDTQKTIDFLNSTVKQEEILNSGYNNILKQNEKQFTLSINYLNYDPTYIKHLKNIMKGNIKYFSLICDPLQRLISHYYHSNSFRTIYNFDEYYHHFGNMGNVGWTGKKDKTNNYFSYYYGFNETELTEEKIKERFSLVLVAEKEKESIEKLKKLFNIKKIETLSLKKHNHEVLDFTKKRFMENNKLDYKLYDICCDLIEKEDN
jgi:hypothetical protein